MTSHEQPDPGTAAAAEEPRSSRGSFSSVSTTSIVFDRIYEEAEKQSLHRKRQDDHDGDRGAGTGYADLDGDQQRDLETGPFLQRDDGGDAPDDAFDTTSDLPGQQHMDRGLRRILIIAGAVFVLGWLASLGVFIATGSHHHLSDADHDPDADSRGSGKSVTLEQVQSGYWSPKSHSISWIADPDGADGLVLEIGGAGKDYIVVEDVRAGHDGGGGDAEDIVKPRTLMKQSVFSFGGISHAPSVVEPSPDLKKVLLGVDREKNWRRSYTASYYILDVATQKVEPLVYLDAGARLQLAAWSPKSDAVAFVRDDNNLYIRRVGDTDVVQVTRDGGAECFNGVPDWVYEEEVIQGRSATWWSDDGKHLAFLRTNETGVPEYPIQYFVSRPSGAPPHKGEENYPEVRQLKYPKPGAHNPVVEVRFYDVAADEVFGIDAVGSQLPDDDRIINHVIWAGPGQVLVKQTNRVSDVLRVVLVDVAARTARTVRERDIGAEDGGWFEISRSAIFVPADPDNGRPHDGYVDSVIHQGYDHLAYFAPLDASEPAMLTSGEWEVDHAPSAVDLKRNLVYFVAAKESPTQRHVYSVSLVGQDNGNDQVGGEPQALTDTSAEAYYDASFSSGAGYVLLTYRGPRVPHQRVVSTSSSPGETPTYERVIESNAELAQRARTHALPVLKYGEVEVDDGVRVAYVERRPPHFDKSKTYPVLFHQYSGPGSQQVDRKFAVDFQSYVASSLGYVVVTVDPRGTGYRGRAHRVPVRGRLGLLEASDHVAAARHFASLPYVDASRLAIWGWSYGGFTALKTLEHDAGATFSYGMAVAPVTDWRFYDSVYAERYMGTPASNDAGYDASAVANATALTHSVRFLLMHGVADDNVHLQNSLVLLDRLDLEGADNYDVHLFPDSDHGLSQS
ncbi:dipeptidyl aminopeptidase [Geosmithia morbida]|uniref:Probable dipeptidyl-aminopeptidase B n=1 Tax=Geosmithia morbida TaxID=1094350 RepID=A0A9P4YXY6_9HYPO|nr:dipeptidyl aminopeptidase [Geosmithia morbida]KAF4123044.1 dipeptidyl aminopeptidase [Geosmithia morbida]